MGITPAQGRALAGADDLAGAAVRAAVVSDRWWRSRLNADPSVLGRQVRLNGAMFTVVGVAPPSFHGSYDAVRTDLWVPLMPALSTGFGALALLLLLVGTYGVTAHVVAGRRREFALRMALGADPMSLRAAIVRRAIMWGLPGALVGLVLAGVLGQLLRRFLFGVSTTDPLTFGVAALVVVGTAALAAYLPARRVARAELATQLRT